MKYIFLTLYALILAHESLQACQEKTGLTECVNTAIRRDSLETIGSQTVTLSMKHGPSNSEISRGTFRSLPNLENLYLSFDNIVTLQPGCFQGLSNLKQLYLTNNELDTIPNGVFDPCRRLKMLKLNLNKIRTIETRAFNEIVELEELDLSSNLLDGIPNLNSLLSLKELNLGYNKLTSINSRAFSSLTRLVSLKLNDNLVSVIHDGAFQGLGSLSELDIRGNHLTSLNVGNIAQTASNLQSISISLNDFRCNDLREIIAQLQQNNIEVTSGVSKTSTALNGIPCKS